jgi:hypothetical protein
MKMLNLKSSFTYMLIFYSCKVLGQPLLRPLPFEDIYNGVYDFEMREAKVKKKKSYFFMNDSETSKTLYSVFEYNRGGYIVNQIFYNLQTGKPMYSAHYEYDEENYFKSCEEKVTKEIEQYAVPPAKMTNDNSYFNDKNGEPEFMPCNKDSNWIVKSMYERDSMGNYKVKKYFYDGTFYKEKEHPFWERSPFMFENMYVNKDLTIDYVFSPKMYKTDTIYPSKDTVIITARSKFTDELTHRLVKVRFNDDFIFTEIERIYIGMKLYFRYSNIIKDAKIKNSIEAITYISNRITNGHKSFLIHYFYGDKESLIIPIELIDFFKSGYYNDNFLDGCTKYTYFKGGQKKQESLFATDSGGIKKFNDIYYTNKNLIYQRVQYRASFGIERSSILFNHNVDEAVEINEYEYFD